MSASVNLTALSEYTIRKYGLAGFREALYKSAPTVAKMAKESSKLASEAFYTTINAHMGYQAPSEDFAAGMANGSARKGYRFLIDGPKQLYTRVTIDGITLARSSTGMLIDLKGPELDHAAHGLMTTAERKLWGDDVGSIGELSTVAGTATERIFTLANTQDIYNIEYGAVLSFHDDADGLATDANMRGDTFRVTAVNHADGIFNATRIGSAADVVTGDFIWIAGGRPCDAGLASGGRSIPGIPSFIPATAPTTTFLGLDRTGLGPLASGWRQTFTGSIENTIQSLIVKMSRFVQRPGARWQVCLSAGDWFKLQNEVSDRIVRFQKPGQEFGTNSLGVLSGSLGGGVIECVVVPALRDGRGYLLDWSSWVMHHLKEMPHIIKDDGNVWLRQAPGSVSATAGSYPGTTGYDSLNGDGVECRFRMLYHPMCVAPGSNGTFATA